MEHRDWVEFFQKSMKVSEYIDPESVSTRVITTKDYIIVNGVKVIVLPRRNFVEIPGTEKYHQQFIQTLISL